MPRRLRQPAKRCADPGWVLSVGSPRRIAAYGVVLTGVVLIAGGCGGAGRRTFTFGPASALLFRLIVSRGLPGTPATERNARRAVAAARRSAVLRDLLARPPSRHVRSDAWLSTKMDRRLESYSSMPAPADSGQRNARSPQPRKRLERRVPRPRSLGGVSTAKRSLAARCAERLLVPWERHDELPARQQAPTASALASG